MALLTHIDGDVDAQRLVAAFAAVVRSSQTLRLTISDADAAFVVDDVPAESQIIDLPRSAVRSWADERVLEPIDVSAAVYDSVVIRHGDSTLSWYLCIHHVATDATSSALVFQATARAYHDEPIGLADLDPTPLETNKRRQRAVVFWNDRSPAPLIESLYQPIESRTTDVSRHRVDGLVLEGIEAALDGPYRMISRDLAWTALLMTALSVHLHRVSGADCFAIGLPVHNRSGRDRHNVVGPLMEVYPVDITVDPGASFADLHRHVSKQLLRVVGNAFPDVGASASDVSGIVNVIPRGSLGSFGPEATSTDWIHPKAADPYHLLGVQLTTYGSETPSLELDINAAGADALHQLEATGHFRSILESMLADPEQSIFADPLGAPTDSETSSWGSGPPLSPTRFLLDPRAARLTGSVIDRLSVALSNGSRPALIDGHTSLTGQQLWSKAGAVAGSLVAAGIGPGHRVGIEIARSADAVIAILGVLRAGASYVPIDPTHPKGRRQSLSDQAGVSGVLTDLDGIDHDATMGNRASIGPDDEAYVLFTSGSTGEPKGVPISHGGLADYLAFACQSYLGPKQRRPVVPLFTSLGFDLTVTSLFVPLIAGGTLVIVGQDGVPGLREVSSRSDLTWIKATPSHLELLSRMLPPTHRISTMVVGGEAFPARLAKDLAAGHPGIEIFNEYGPTEAVVGCMIHRFDVRTSVTSAVPIGRPAPGVTLRIVDPGGHEVPRGVAGELLISSDGLSPGYLGQPRNTAPFHEVDGRRWYASGDVVRHAGSEGAVYLGRVDDQIKLNGVRLEPAEVGAALESHPGISRAVVRLWQPNAETRPVLGAWVERTPGVEEVQLPALRAFLLNRLTSQQIPAAVAFVDELPFNNNGKLDIEALPAPERLRAPSEGEVHPLDERAAILVSNAWRRALGLSNEVQAMAADDDFFVLGGDSLAALEMTANLGDSIEADISEGLIFAASTFGDFVAAVADIDRTAGRPTGPIALGGPPELSPGERAMVFEHQLVPESPRYNIGRRYVVNTLVDAERLLRAAGQVVARHAPLHTTFGTTRRSLGVREALHFSTLGLGDDALLSDEISRVAADALYRAPFDLETGPLVRVALHRLDGDVARSAVVVVTHHISGDAGSLDRFWADLDAAYSGETLTPLSISYADHAAWQHGRDQGAGFWSDLWQQPVETSLGLPGAAESSRGGYVEQPASFSASALRQGPGRTPTATAVAALAKLLDRHHHPLPDDRPGRYAIGLTASVREHSMAEPMVGYFLNTLPLVIEVDHAEASVAELASRVNGLLGAALPHRSHPFAEMVAKARRDHRQLPIPEILLAVEDLADALLDGHHAEHEVIASGEAIAPATVFVQIRGERVDLGIEFAGAVLDEARALLLLDDVDALISEALSGTTGPPATPLDRLVLPSERRAMLDGGPAADDAPLMASIMSHAGSDAIAARSGSSTLTWDALGRRSAVLAEQLRLNGAGPGDRVAVSLGRSVDLVVAMVAVLRVGAVYVPLDPTYPAERRERILGAATPLLAVVEPGAEFAWLPCTTVPGDRADDATFIDHVAQSSDPAYVIFTSGSTGRPKGVEVTHGQLATSTRARDGVYQGRPQSFLLLSSIGFDSSIVGLFWSLLAGGEIVIPTEAEAHDPDALLELIDRNTISHVLMVPSLYRALLTRGAASAHWPRVVTVAGEACSVDLVAQHHQLRPASELWNEYGPTEGTVWATAHRCAVGDDPVPIGRPIPGAWSAVVDASGHPVPLGAVGELMIGGAGVVAGYLPDATAPATTAFVDQTPWGPGYRTGDAVVLGMDRRGERTLLFRGRVDDQLNLGGVRLEPGEVEAVLVAVDGVADAALVAAAVGASERLILVAHVECEEATVVQLKEAADASLPKAVRPQRYVVHERLPKTPHGKVDRIALAATELVDDLEATPTTDVEMLTTTERQVLELFRRNLRFEVDIDEGFFDVGGDSLAALTLAMDLEDHFGRAFSVTALLVDPTARAVASQFAPAQTASATVGEAAVGEAAVDEVESSLVRRAGADESTLVEWIRPGVDTQPVLVLLAPGSGHLLGYEPLIRALDPSTPILGVRLPGYDGKAEPIASITDLASIVGPLLDEALAQRVSSVDDRGAVLLGGSSGGLLAWELQHRAEVAGRPFSGIIMQDTVHPDWRRDQARVGFVEDLRRRYEAGGASSVVAELYGRGERRFSRWRRAQRSRTQAAKTGAELPAVIAQRMFSATLDGLLAYEVPDLGTRVLFVAAANTDPDATFDRWNACSTDFAVKTFDGDHFGDNGITAAKNVGPVAATIDQLLRTLTPEH